MVEISKVMAKQDSGFGDLKGNPVVEMIGQWVIFHTDINSTFPGYFREVRGDYAVLNPFTFGEFITERGANRRKCVLRESDSLVRLSNIVVIEPVTKKDLEDYCDYRSKQEK